MKKRNIYAINLPYLLNISHTSVCIYCNKMNSFIIQKLLSHQSIKLINRHWCNEYARAHINMNDSNRDGNTKGVRPCGKCSPEGTYIFSFRLLSGQERLFVSLKSMTVRIGMSTTSTYCLKKQMMFLSYLRWSGWLFFIWKRNYCRVVVENAHCSGP